MSAHSWWKERRSIGRPRLWWLRRREITAEAPGRLSILSPSVSIVDSITPAPITATPAAWLSPVGPVAVGRVLSHTFQPLSEPIPLGRPAPTPDRPMTTGVPASAVRRKSSQPTLAQRLRIVMALPLDLLLPGNATVLEWPGVLFPYQIDGVRALLARKQILVADDMGLGKTIQAAAAMRILCLQREIERVLLIVPASLTRQWRRELTKWAPELRLIIIQGPAADRAWQWKADAHVTIVSYETLRSDFATNPDLAPRRRLWDLIVLDEAQKIKNRDTVLSRQVKQLRRKRSWAMTGTPLENKLDDLASILEYVDGTEDSAAPRYVPGPMLLERHKELQLRRRKSDVLSQLPPKQVITLSVQLPSRQRAAYVRAEREGIIALREQGAEIRIENVLALITRLKQICNVDPQSGESSKLNDIRERLSVLTEQGHRALLFSQYTDDRFGVGAAANALTDFDPITYSGDMSSAERDLMIQRFKSESDRKILILSLRAGGVGLNLQEASYVFHLDRWWNPAVERQAEDRSHRMGQLVPVTVFKYTCEETIEERIAQILTEKQKLFDDTIDDVSLDITTRLNRQEIFGLFGLESPAKAVSDRRGD